MGKSRVLFSLRIILLFVFVSVSMQSRKTLGSTLKSTNSLHSFIIHEGNLTIADNEVYIIDNCIFQQNGTIVVKDNATLIFRNSQINQTNDDRHFIVLMDSAKMIMENSSYLAFQDCDVKISLYEHAILNITASNLTNIHCGIWIWMEDFSRLYLTKVFLYGYGTGSRIVTDDNSIANIQGSKVDFIVCWGYSSVNVYNSIVSEGVKAFSVTKINLSTSYVNYIWAYEMSTIKVQNTIVYSDVPSEVALRAGGESEVFFFYSALEDDINAAGFAKVTLKNSSVKNVSAYENAIIWLINSTATKIILDDQARVYSFFLNVLSKEAKVLLE